MCFWYLRIPQRRANTPATVSPIEPNTIRTIYHAVSSNLSTALRTMTAERALAVLAAVICIFWVYRMLFYGISPYGPRPEMKTAS